MRCYIAYFHSTLLIKVVLTSNGTGNGTHGIQKQVELQDVQFTGHYLGGDFDEIAYDKSKAQRIINHEDIMLKTYSKIISTYTTLFEQYDCSLKVRLFWIDFSTERRSNRRLPFRIGYACYVCCEVQRDGKEVQVKSADGEADYYSLSATWMVSSIERSFLKAKASLYSDTDDIENDMKELFRLLSNDQ